MAHVAREPGIGLHPAFQIRRRGIEDPGYRCEVAVILRHSGAEFAAGHRLRRGGQFVHRAKHPARCGTRPGGVEQQSGGTGGAQHHGEGAQRVIDPAEGQRLSPTGSPTIPRLRAVLRGASWAVWVVFVGEFAFRLYLAPCRAVFLRRNWWQLIFLAVPFLRFLRLFWVLRTARVGRLLSAAVRGSRSAGRCYPTAWCGLRPSPPC